MGRKIRALSGVAGLIAAVLSPVSANADPTAQACPTDNGRGQARILVSVPDDSDFVMLKDADDLGLQLRTADGWNEPELNTKNTFAINQSRTSASAKSHLYVAIAKSSTNTDLSADLRKNWSRSPHTPVGSHEVVEESQGDYQGFPSWYLRVRGTNQLADGTVCCISEEAHREIAVRTATSSYLITIHSGTSSPNLTQGCRPIPEQRDFDSGAAQPRNGLTIQAT